ncbi:MAG: hypothetical protein ACI8UO_000239 [Verrucomicrobiales bacterium]|jgi:hypothetical protein
MPFTIHLAKTEAEARIISAVLAIDYQVHQRIFDSTKAEFHDLPLFYHLSDFYQDAIFLESQVLSFRAELDQARARIFDSRATDVLSVLSKLCDRAFKRRLSIFGFSEGR